MRKIAKHDETEYILHAIPGAISYLVQKEVCGMNCCKPVWGTLAYVAKVRGFSDVEIDEMVSEINSFIFKQDESVTA